jgi:hypothetical protein
MRIARSLFLNLFWLFFTLAVGGGLFWANLNFAQHVKGGVDFISPWTAIQDFALRGDSPYEAATTQDIQTQIYGRPAAPGEHPYRVDLPFHLLILSLPFLVLARLLGLAIDLTLARAFWMILLEVALLGVASLSLAQARWKPHWLFLSLLLLFCAFWLPSVSSLFSGNSILLQAFLLVGALRAIDQGADELGGALAAVALVNVQATGLAFLLILVWAVSVERWRVFAGFGMTLVVLIGLAQVLLPAWFFPFLSAVFGNWRAGAFPSTYSIFEGWFPGIGSRLAQILAVAALTVLLFEWGAVRGKDVRWLFWTTSLTAALSPLLGFPYLPAWLAFTLPGLLLAVATMGRRWGPFGLGSAALVLVLAFLGLWAAQWQGLIPVFLLVYPFLLTLVLYWVRWSAIRPPRLWADEISLRG